MSCAGVHTKLRFGSFKLSIGEWVLRRDGLVLLLGGRVLDILIFLPTDRVRRLQNGTHRKMTLSKGR